MPSCSAKYPPRAKTLQASGLHAGQRGSLPRTTSDGRASVSFGRRACAVYPPTVWRPTPTDFEPPDCVLRREWVYGYDGSVKGAVHFISEEECVYPVAALVVIEKYARSPDQQSQQRFFEGHSRAVRCLHWNERRRLCISGQTDPKGAGQPYVCVWAPDFCSETISQLHHHERQVSAVAFSDDGRTAVSFGGEDAHIFCVWRDFARWDGVTGPSSDDPSRPSGPEKKAPMYSISSGRQATYAIFMASLGPNSDGQSMSFYTVGEKHFKQWSVSLRRPGEDPEVVQKRGCYGKAAQPKSPLYISHTGQIGKAYMVADNGYFYILKGNCVVQACPLGDVPLGCVAALPGNRWMAGSMNGTIFLGRADPLPHVEERLSIGQLVGHEGLLFCNTAVARLANSAAYWKPSGGNKSGSSLVLLGTSNGALFLTDLNRPGEGTVLQVSHNEEAWAMDFHPSLAILATGSVAKDVRFWNVAERRPAVGKVLKTDHAIWALAFHPEGALLALGCSAGKLEVYGFPSLQPVFSQVLPQGAAERICDVRFSVSGSLLGAACWDQNVYLLKVHTAQGAAPARVEFFKALSGHCSSPLCVMFTKEDDYIMSNSKDAEILHWRTKDGRRETSIAAFRDTAWQAPWTCLLGWHVLGVWGDPNYDQTDVNSVCQSSAPNDGYIALGDDYGKVKLFRFPSPYLEPPYRVYTGHSSHVTRVKFSRTNVLATLGGDDRSISQWVLEVPRKQSNQPRPMVHPWVHLHEADFPNNERFSFLGRPRPEEHLENLPAPARDSSSVPSERGSRGHRSGRPASAPGARRVQGRHRHGTDAPKQSIAFAGARTSSVPRQMPEAEAAIDAAPLESAPPPVLPSRSTRYNWLRSPGVGSALQWG